MCVRRTPVRAARTARTCHLGPRNKSHRSMAPLRPTDQLAPLPHVGGTQSWRRRRRRACLAARRALPQSGHRPRTPAERERSRPRGRSTLQARRPSGHPGRAHPPWEPHRPGRRTQRRSEPGSSRPGDAPAQVQADSQVDDGDNEHVAGHLRHGAPGSTRRRRPRPHVHRYRLRLPEPEYRRRSERKRDEPADRG